MTWKTSAEVAKERGWRVGTVLAGSAIRNEGGAVIEGPLRIKITAIGRDMVLACREGYGHWINESSWGFDSREWVAE